MGKRFFAAVACLAILALGTAAGVATATTGKATKLSAPVIHEDFTLLPCGGRPSHRSTLQLEGCGEHTVLRWDAQIDTLNARIFKKLPEAAARRQFITGHNAWLSYRRKYCLSTAAPDTDGTLAGVVYINCVATVNGQHVQELNSFLKSVSH